MIANLSDKDLTINVVQLKKAVLFLRAMNNKLRQQMIRVIHEHPNITVTELYVKLRLEQSVASQHLTILREARLVTTKRKGKFIYYSIDYRRMAEVHDFSEGINSEK